MKKWVVFFLCVSAMSLRAAKLCLIGDSITWSTCYPIYLQLKFQAAKADVTFVGALPMNDGAGMQCPNGVGYSGPMVCAHGGYGTGTIASTLPGWLGSMGSANAPDIAMVHAGSNDMGMQVSNGITINDVLNGYTSIVATLRANNPNIKIIVAKIFLKTSDSASANESIALNNAIPGWAASNTTVQSPISVADCATGYNLAMTNDGLHPNDSGSHFMAARVYTAVMGVMGGTGVVALRTPVSDTMLHFNWAIASSVPTLAYTLPAAGMVSLKVVNLLSEEIATLVQGEQSAGTHRVSAELKNHAPLPAGVYLCRLNEGNFTGTKRLVVTK